LIELKNFTKKFGRRLLFNAFNLKVDKGEMLAIVGPSGSGKSTLLNTIGLLEEVDSGEYHLFHRQAPKINSKASEKLIREKINYLFQNFALIHSESVEANLMIALKYVKMEKREKRKAVLEVLIKVGLEKSIK